MAILRHGGEQYVTPENILYPDVMEYLKQCAQGMELMNKLVVMAFCEYKLSDVFPSSHKPAEELPPNFIVVCIRFINDSIYQPIGTLFLYNDSFNGYSPSEKELADCLRLYILAVSRLSFMVVGTVSPPSYTFKKALSNLTGIQNITAYSGPLMYSVAEVTDIVHIFDPPSLLKGFRNLFLRMDIEYKMNNNKFCASCKDINTLHLKGRLPFLEEEHISPDSEVFHPNFAVELFSNKVSSAIAQAIKSGLLSKGAMGTSLLVKMFNDLFDSFNSVYTDKNNASSHMLLWDKVLKFLDTITFLDRNLNAETYPGESKIPEDGLLTGPGYYSFQDSDPGDSLCGSDGEFLQEFRRIDKNLTTQIEEIQKLKKETLEKYGASQGRLRVLSNDLLYNTSLEDEKRSSDTSETKSDVETSNTLNEKLEDEMKRVDGKIEIPLLKCTADIRLASDQNEVTNSSKTVKTRTKEKLRQHLRDRDSAAADKTELLKNFHSDKNDVKSPSSIKEGISNNFDENKREDNTGDSFLGNNLRNFFAGPDVKGYYGFMEESGPGRDDKNEHIPLLSKENKANYKSTATSNTNSSKQNESCEVKGTIEEVVQEKIHHSEFDRNKVSSNVSLNDVDELISEKCPLNNTIDKDKSSNDSVKNLNMYTENNTNKNEVNTLNDKTEVKVVNVKNHLNHKVKEEKRIEDSVTSSLAKQISHLNIVENISPKTETNLNMLHNVKNDNQKTTKENDLNIQKEMETQGFESDSETDIMPPIPINEILEKLEVPEKKPDDSGKALLLDQTATPQSLALDRTLRKHEIINNWMTSVEGIQRIVKMLEGRGAKQINAKAFCVDCIHDFINDARKSNEMNVSHQVSPNSPFKMLDEPHGILAMVRGSVVLLKS